MLLWARNKFWYPVLPSMGETSCVGMGCCPPERLPLAYQGLVQWVTVKVKKIIYLPIYSIWNKWNEQGVGEIYFLSRVETTKLCLLESSGIVPWILASH